MFLFNYSLSEIKLNKVLLTTIFEWSASTRAVSKKYVKKLFVGIYLLKGLAPCADLNGFADGACSS